MSGFLVDTSVVSSLAPGKPRLLPSQRAWFLREEDRLYLSAITVAEIVQGTEKLRRNGASGRAEALESWLAGLTASFASRVLPIDGEVAIIIGRMADASVAAGRHPGLADLAIAATAKAHGFSVATRNLRHFEPLGIDVIDPLAA